MTCREARLRFLCFVWIPIRSWFLVIFNPSAAAKELDMDMRAVEEILSDHRWREWE